jgi:hypothetical protein
LQRQINLRPPTTETDTTITGVTRWAAAAAAFASMSMLIGALDGSSAQLALVLGAVGLGVVVSLWVARRSGRRPVLMQLAIIAAKIARIGSLPIAQQPRGAAAALRARVDDG